MRRALWAITCAALCLGAREAAADDPPATVTAKKESVEFHVDVTGTLDASAAAEVAAKMQAYDGELEVEDCAAPGPVAKGAPLVRFKTEKIDEQIRNAERDLAAAKAALAVQTEEQSRQAALAASTLTRAETEAKNAEQALSVFETVEMALRLETSAFWLEGTRNYLQDQTEELAQLEKMYKADDLTEATEEIVLSRTKRDIERIKKGLGFETKQDELLRTVEMPREHERRKLDVRHVLLERDRLRAVTELQIAQARLEVAKSAAAVEQSEKQLGKLRADRGAFALVAPDAGLATPGALVRGKWQGTDDVARQLRKGGKLKANDVVFTIVKQGAVRVLASLPEAAFAQAAVGQDAQVAPGVLPGSLFAAKLMSARVTSAGTDYELSFDLASTDDHLFPGQSCKVRIATGTRTAIVVPATAVDDRGFDKWVYVLADGRPQKRAVRVGAAVDDRVELVSGVAEGDKVLETAPKK